MPSEAFGTVESVKAVSELFAPVSGEVVEVNDGLTRQPEQVNRIPTRAWMVSLKLTPTRSGCRSC